MLKKAVKLWLLSMGLMLLSSCGFHFQNGDILPSTFKNITLESRDPYDPMLQILHKQLLLKNVQLMEKADNNPILVINQTSLNSQVASLFLSGYEAEKVLSLEVDATVILANQQRYPIHVVVNRTFFDNSRAALAKYAEKETLVNDMREQAARKIINQLISLPQ